VKNAKNLKSHLNAARLFVLLNTAAPGGFLALVLVATYFSDGRSLHLSAFGILLNLCWLWWGLAMLFLDHFLTQRGYTISPRLLMSEAEAGLRAPVFPPRFSESRCSKHEEERTYYITTRSEFELILQQESRKSDGK